MTGQDIFISYTEQDRERVRPLVRALEAAGYSVFWDLEIPVGREWAEFVEEQISHAKDVIVVWSEKSVQSRWVKLEANDAWEQDKYIGVVIDEVNLSLQYRANQTARLLHWEGDSTHREWLKLLEGLKSDPSDGHNPDMPEQPANDEIVRPEVVEPKKPKHTFRLVLSSGLITALLLFGAWKFYKNKPVSDNTQHQQTENIQEESVTIAEQNASNEKLAIPVPEMVAVQAGCFLMGSPKGVGYDFEYPQHEVCIKRDFEIGRYEVTFDQYDAYAEQTKEMELPDDAGWGRNTQPVINVSWQEAKDYAGWLGTQVDKSCRLPSEAEWEYAARAGTDRVYWWGDEIGDNNANCDGCGSQWDNKQTAPVGSFDANPFGLYDTSGNVWEWTEDHWHDNYEGAPADGSAWMEGKGGDEAKRVVRGGSWVDSPVRARSAYRYWYLPHLRLYYLGFRVLCVPHS